MHINVAALLILYSSFVNNCILRTIPNAIVRIDVGLMEVRSSGIHGKGHYMMACVGSAINNHDSSGNETVEIARTRRPALLC